MSAVAAHIDARNAEIQAKWDAAPDKQLAIDPSHYLDVVLKDRAARYAAHMAKMDIPPEMALFALAMSQRFGSYVKVHHFIADWLTSLLIVRYGEECDPALSEMRNDGSPGGWPLTFDDADKQRALQLVQLKNWPGDSMTLLDDASAKAREMIK